MILREAKKLIGEVATLELKVYFDKLEITDYAGLGEKFRNSDSCDEKTDIYYEACSRINSVYLPDIQHEERYIGEHDKKPVSFDEIRRLYGAWNIDTDFETFFETWERIVEKA